MPLHPTIYRFVNVPFIMLSHTKHIGQSKFAFKVPPQMTKPEIKVILERMYGVQVLKINTMNYEGRLKRNGRKSTYRTKRYKKAYVTIDDTDAIALPEPTK